MLQTTSWRRRVISAVPFATAAVGVLLVFGSVLVFEAFYAKIAAVTFGLLVLLWGAWYGTNPYLTSERRFIALRAELDRFIGLARLLNTAATTTGADEEVERVRSKMHDSVDRMAELAGKEE